MIPQTPSPEDLASLQASAKEGGQEHWSRELALALYLHGKIIHDEGLSGPTAGDEALRIIRRRIARRMLRGLSKGLAAGRVVHESLETITVPATDTTPERQYVRGNTYRRPEGHLKPWQKRRKKRQEARL